MELIIKDLGVYFFSEVDVLNQAVILLKDEKPISKISADLCEEVTELSLVSNDGDWFFVVQYKIRDELVNFVPDCKVYEVLNPTLQIERLFV